MSWSELNQNSSHLDPFENCKVVMSSLSKCFSRSDEMCMSLTFPFNHSISSTFNVKKLVAYIGQLVMLDDPFKDPLSDPNNPILDPVQLSLPPVQ